MARRTAAGPVPVTASFGVAQHRPGSDAGELVAEADAMLYAAKAAGRDTVRGRQVPSARSAEDDAVAAAEGRDEPAQQT